MPRRSGKRRASRHTRYHQACTPGRLGTISPTASIPELGTGRVTAIDGRILVVAVSRGTTLRFAADERRAGPRDRGDGAQGTLAHRAAGRGRGRRHRRLPDAPRHPAACWRRARQTALAPSSVDACACSRTSCTSPSARPRGCRCGGCWPTKSGSGKTIEAALIMNRLLHTQKIERCLVVAPEALTVQWLGELWRKYHQVFTLLDRAETRRCRAGLRRRVQSLRRPSPCGDRSRDARRAAGPDDAGGERRHRPAGGGRGAAAAASAADTLASRATARSRRSPRSDATSCCSARPRWKTMRTASSGCCSCCGPTNFRKNIDFEARLASGVPLPPCTSSTRRVDIGGLPPRVPMPVDLAPQHGMRATWQSTSESSCAGQR